MKRCVYGSFLPEYENGLEELNVWKEGTESRGTPVSAPKETQSGGRQEQTLAWFPEKGKVRILGLCFQASALFRKRSKRQMEGMADMGKGHPNGIYDAIVVGAGIQGTFAAQQLSKRGQKTLLLDQFLLPHTRGSSHGLSRIIRSAYPQDYYTAMMGESIRLWKELEAETGAQLYRQTPLWILGRHESPEFQSYRRTMERHHVPSEELGPEAFAHRFPGFHLPSDEMAVSDRSAGVLFPDKALRVVQDQFRHNGGTIRDGEKVLQIIPGSVVRVVTSKGEYHAKRIVVAAGPWTGPLLEPLGLRLPLQPLRISVCYWKENQPGVLRELPSFISLHGAKHDIYGLPAGDYPGLVKVCYHYGNFVDPETPDRLTQSSPPIPDIQILKDFVRKYLPGLDPEPAVQERCLYTNTPDEDFVLDWHPRFKNIVIGAGFSGHGFKFGPVIGKILCQLSLGEEPSHDLTPFRISRFPQAAL